MISLINGVKSVYLCLLMWFSSAKARGVTMLQEQRERKRERERERERDRETQR